MLLWPLHTDPGARSGELPWPLGSVDAVLLPRPPLPASPWEKVRLLTSNPLPESEKNLTPSGLQPIPRAQRVSSSGP